MMKAEKTLVGWIVILIVLSILFSANGSLSDGIGAALGLFFLSIICTLGLSFFIWIPLGFGVGMVVFDIFGRIFLKIRPSISDGIGQVFLKITGLDKILGTKPAKDAQQLKTKGAASLPRDKQALLNYIKKAREKRLPNHQILKNLGNNGWTTDEVNWAFDALK